MSAYYATDSPANASYYMNSSYNLNKSKSRIGAGAAHNGTSPLAHLHPKQIPLYDADNQSTLSQTIRCPYIPDHVMHPESLATHLIRCKATNKNDFKICIFNSLHVIPNQQYQMHIKGCKYKNKIQQMINNQYQNSFSQGAFQDGDFAAAGQQDAQQIPYIQIQDQQEEDWDQAASRQQNHHNSYYQNKQHSRSSSSHSYGQKQEWTESEPSSYAHHTKNFYDFYGNKDDQYVSDQPKYPDYQYKKVDMLKNKNNKNQSFYSHQPVAQQVNRKLPQIQPVPVSVTQKQNTGSTLLKQPQDQQKTVKQQINEIKFQTKNQKQTKLKQIEKQKQKEKEKGKEKEKQKQKQRQRQRQRIKQMNQFKYQSQPQQFYIDDARRKTKLQSEPQSQNLRKPKQNIVNNQNKQQPHSQISSNTSTYKKSVQTVALTMPSDKQTHQQSMIQKNKNDIKTGTIVLKQQKIAEKQERKDVTMINIGMNPMELKNNININKDNYNQNCNPSLNQSRYEDDQLIEFINEIEGKVIINDKNKINNSINTSNWQNQDHLGDFLAEQASMIKNKRNKNKKKKKKTNVNGVDLPSQNYNNYGYAGNKQNTNYGNYGNYNYYNDGKYSKDNWYEHKNEEYYDQEWAGQDQSSDYYEQNYWNNNHNNYVDPRWNTNLSKYY